MMLSLSRSAAVCVLVLIAGRCAHGFGRTPGWTPRGGKGVIYNDPENGVAELPPPHCVPGCTKYPDPETGPGEPELPCPPPCSEYPCPVPDDCCDPPGAYGDLPLASWYAAASCFAEGFSSEDGSVRRSYLGCEGPEPVFGSQCMEEGEPYPWPPGTSADDKSFHAGGVEECGCRRIAKGTGCWHLKVDDGETLMTFIRMDQCVRA